MIKRTLFVFLTVLAPAVLAQNNCVYLASDILTGAPGSLPVGITEYNGALYFSATGNSSGAELWKYENGVTSMVADINPGAASSLPNQLTVLGANLYFTATTNTTGMELFKYDGVSVTVAADIFPGVAGSQVSYLTAIGSELYFTANDGVAGMEPWKFNGAVASLVSDINPGSGGSNANGYAGAGGNVYFTAFHPTAGFELWKYDGVTPVMYDLYPGPSGSDIGEITPCGSKVCFRATNGTQGYELWVHDGTNATCLDVCTTGPGDFTPWELTPLGSNVYFRGFISGIGYELWKFDGTTATMVADIFPGAGNAHPNNITAGATVLYFAASDGVNGNELWMHDGVSTTMVADLQPGSAGSMPVGWLEKFVTIGDNVFIVADDGSSGNELWRFDGSSVELGKNIVPGGSSVPSGMMGFGNTLFFMADNTIHGNELWAWNLDQVLTESLTEVSCGDYLSPAGDLYTVEGVYDFVDTIPSISCPGCDSIIDIHLTVSNPNSSLTVTACNSYTSPSGVYFNVPGNYVFTDTILSSICPGVDSIISIDLTIVDYLNTSIFVFSGVVFVNQPGASYQWLDCDASSAPIPGETNQDFLPTVDGNYACVITIGSCSDTTACVFVESTFGVGLSDQDETVISVYPNPVTEQLYVISETVSFMSVRVFNSLGSEVFSEKQQQTDKMKIDMSQFANGIYHVEISTDTGNYIRKIVKE